jgi:hypothetical protein
LAIEEILKKPDYAALSRDLSLILLADAVSGLMALSLIITNNLTLQMSSDSDSVPDHLDSEMSSEGNLGFGDESGEADYDDEMASGEEGE